MTALLSLRVNLTLVYNNQNLLVIRNNQCKLTRDNKLVIGERNLTTGNLTFVERTGYATTATWIECTLTVRGLLNCHTLVTSVLVKLNLLVLWLWSRYNCAHANQKRKHQQ